MNKMDALNQLGPITDEMLAGLHADTTMKIRIREAATAKPARPAMRFAPALCCAALAIACVGVAGLRGVSPAPKAAQIETIAAGDGAAVVSRMQLADLGDGARVSAAAPKNTSLFAEGTCRWWR